ncbi:alpha/beta hydrolase [Rhodococcus sp. SRB_17]|uniref:alpha/beta fold hydrolase n=1 Tax=Rhodococcus sp. OK302 TaxID=1882769 RepID=UPI000B9410A0|nr:alpha/beta hydrolase [Rhodococcus sp. OK302]NMM84473.1 alpha/beta hydrolase [Rhodococcus sp. SRB_17]OYD66602.1 pimeloyl-ACP methyl ester carboxylesterase [Rhodococcus sp. OK302]
MSNTNIEEVLAVPDWFTKALSAPVETGALEVEGATIRFRAWGPVGPGIILVHGGGAHNRWWDHVGPQLAHRHRVVALDMSGHGDSDARTSYEMAQWGREALAAGRAGGIEGKPILVGHSMGGMVSFVTAHEYGEELAGVVIIDSPVFAPTPEEEAGRHQVAFGPKKVYPSSEVAKSRFRFVPPQDAALPYVRDHVVETSMVAADGGWSWKFDPNFFLTVHKEGVITHRPRCRTAYFRAENGIIFESMMDRIRDLLGPEAIIAEIPDAGHHVMIDQPLQLVTGIRTVLSAWESL